MIDKMASDLGISFIEGEEIELYRSRVVYSAIACWIKASTLDRPVGCENERDLGVSKRHVFDRCNLVLDKYLEMYPDIQEWFKTKDKQENAVNLIRTRLINHGDLLYRGFDTSISLSAVRTKQVSPAIETVYGVILDDDIQYSGISTIRHTETKNFAIESVNVQDWFNSFITELGWSKSLPDFSQMQFFDPFCVVMNNYSAWQESIGKTIDGIVLARMPVNKNMYSYYLIRPKEGLSHNIDPFLKEQLYHVRVMYAMRSFARNHLSCEIVRSGDYVKLHLNARLPKAESMVLENYAWPINSIDDNFDWGLRNDVWEYVFSAINSLCIDVKEVQNG